MKQYIQLAARIQCSYVPCANIHVSRVFAAKQPLPFVFSVFVFVARISLVDDLNGLAPIPARRDSPCHCREAPLTSLSAILSVSIMLRFLGPMPGGDHSSPGRVREQVGSLGPPSPSGVLPTGKIKHLLNSNYRISLKFSQPCYNNAAHRLLLPAIISCEMTNSQSCRLGYMPSQGLL